MLRRNGDYAEAFEIPFRPWATLRRFLCRIYFVKKFLDFSAILFIKILNVTFPNSFFYSSKNNEKTLNIFRHV